MGDKLVTLKPVSGYFLNGVPTAVQTVPEDVAERLLATGAFEKGGSKTKQSEAHGEVTARTIAELDALEQAAAEAAAEEPVVEEVPAAEADIAPLLPQEDPAPAEEKE